jgi:2',3'-cyclic-nucleotide 2'-phosphodiesterase (5'-nucleotidase family)
MHKQKRGTMAGFKSGVIVFLLIAFLIIVSDHSMGQERLLITILYTSKMQGNIDPCGCSKNRLGGIETRASLLRLMKTEDNNHALLVDSGDAFASERLYEAFNKARRDFLVKVMNYMGYDVLNIGDTEFGFNQTALKELRAQSKFFFVSSNIMDKTTGEPFFTPYVIRTVGDIKIGILGLITDNLPSRIPQQHIDRLVFADPVITAKKYVPLLKEKSDLIVVLSDLGLSQDKVLAEVIPDIDIIIGGHDGKVLYDPIKIGKVLVLQAGDRGQYVGKLTLEFNEYKKIISSRNELIPADNKVYQPDPYVRKLLKDYRAKERAGRVYGRDDKREKLILPLPQPSGE